MRSERGSTLISTLAIGFAVLLLVGQSLVTMGKITSAATQVEEAAAFAATWAARHGDGSTAREIAQRLAPEAAVQVEESQEELSVIVSIEVSLVGPDGGPLIQVVTGRATVAMSQFRSRR